LGRPVKYLTSSQVSKEAIARGIAVKEGIRDGLVCVLTCVEPCGSFEIHRNRETQKLELERRHRRFQTNCVSCTRSSSREPMIAWTALC